MSNNPLRSDYGGDDKPLGTRGWLVGAAVVLVVIGAVIDSTGGNAAVLYLVAAVLGVAGLIGLAVRD